MSSSLVHFSSRVGNLIMFRESVEPILKAMGLTGVIPSAILPEDIPGAIEKLQASSLFQAHEQATNNNSGTSKTSLRTRAIPLMELLARAQKKNCEILWR